MFVVLIRDILPETKASAKQARKLMKASASFDLQTYVQFMLCLATNLHGLTSFCCEVQMTKNWYQLAFKFELVQNRYISMQVHANETQDC